MRTGKSVFYGWYIVATTWLAYFLLTVPTTYGGSIITTHIVLKNGWSENVIGLVNSVMYASIAISSVPVGFIIRKKGCRFAYILAVIIGAFGYLLLSILEVTIPLYMFLFITGGLSMALGGLVTAPIMINNWFERRKAFPMAITMTAGSIGGFVVPSITEKILSAYGEVACWRIFCMLVAITIIPVLVLMKDSPEEVREVKDGKWWTSQSQKSAEVKEQVRGERELPLSEAYHSREFIVICIEYIVFRIAFAAFMAYAVLYAIQSGLSAASAAALIAIANILSLVGRTLVSFIGRIKISMKIWCAISFLVLTIGYMLLAVGVQTVFFFLASVLIGFSTGFMTTLFPILLPDYCGSTNFSVLYGTMNMVGFAGGIAAPLLVSALSGLFGGYDKSFWGLMILSMLCLFLSFLLRETEDYTKIRSVETLQ